jgi:hypothetical protein
VVQGIWGAEFYGSPPTSSMCTRMKTNSLFVLISLFLENLFKTHPKCVSFRITVFFLFPEEEKKQLK